MQFWPSVFAKVLRWCTKFKNCSQAKIFVRSDIRQLDIYKELVIVIFRLNIDLFFMSLSKRSSLSKLQKEINKELANLQIKRNFSLTTLPSQSSLRSSFSKSVKSIFFDEGSHNRNNQSFKDKSPSPKSLAKEPKMGRSHDVVGIKNAKSYVGKLKKKTT